MIGEQRRVRREADPKRIRVPFFDSDPHGGSPRGTSFDHEARRGQSPERTGLRGSHLGPLRKGGLNRYENIFVRNHGLTLLIGRYIDTEDGANHVLKTL